MSPSPQRPPISVDAFFARYRPIVDDWDAFCEALQRPLPVVLWTNTLRLEAPRLAELLRHEGWDPQPLPWRPSAFRLPAEVRAGKTLAFLTGLCHIQEEVSQLPVTLLDPQPGERLLDMCAAPGGKTLQAAVHMQGSGTVVANDKSKHRLGVLRRGVERLGLSNIAILQSDAGNLPKTMGSFDRLVVDVPCSCLGTSRKNPEIFRLGFQPGARQRGQAAILRKAMQRCRVGGRLVYSTCTYAPEENEAVVHQLLEEADGAVRMLPTRLDGVVGVPGITEWQGERYDASLRHALRVYPHHHDSGGFFVALMEKVAPLQRVAGR